MADLQLYQYLIIALLFVWSGFVRSGLGFGGNLLVLPLLLLVVDDPLLFLPIIGVHLLLFSLLITWQGRKHAINSADADSEPVGNIDWAYLKRALLILIVPKMAGVLGLLTLPGSIMSMIIYGIVFFYAIGYVLNRPLQSNSKTLDIIFLVIGGYFSGTSLIGAPLIVAVFVTHVARHQLRDTLFVLWFILGGIKLASFLIAGVDMHWIHHLWLLPAVYIGHLLGERAHRRLVQTEQAVFYRVMGAGLIVVSTLGAGKILLS
ncbi:MAG: TSUP family transporter [Amphritea sp.]|nr:TSUP family transporter [Amphritea sp.]